MKRSAQVALVLMGVTGTTATAAYVMPSRPACQPAPAASTTVNPPNAMTPGAAPNEPCRRRSWSGWRWNSYSSSHYSSWSSSDDTRYRNPNSYYSRRPSSSVSTGLVASRSGSSGSTSTSSGSSSSSRGGFGSTGHATSGGGHSGS
ncbi:MAG: hypothetical protein WDO17_16950 [Alphaproteobacteria bacterium]